MDATETLLPLMKSVGSSLTPREFYERINIIFHDREAVDYDSRHAAMRASLPLLFRTIIDTVIAMVPPVSNLSMLDVGCGTGLASELLLETHLGPRISKITFVDTSSRMLEQCRERTDSWDVERRWVEGAIEEVTEEGSYDVVLANSVLHHIPDLQRFNEKIQALLTDQGVFIHAQDPLADPPDPAIRDLRQVQLFRDLYPTGLRRLHPLHLLKKAQRYFQGGMLEDRLMADVNRSLLDAGVIERPMSAAEIWSVTDIHVPTRVQEMQHVVRGLSLTALLNQLPRMELLIFRPYNYFGRLLSDLPISYRRQELDLFESGDPNGFQFAAAWSRTGKEH